jgi:hypothetical protein
MKTPSLWMIAAVCFMAPASAAQARSAYDGSWDLAFVTQRGACDPSYNFTVNVSDGVVTHPNLVKFKGYVAKSGSVHASVTVHDKFASGTGRLFRTSGRGIWSDRAGVRDARATGPRNAINIDGKEEHPGDRLHPALLGSGNGRLRAGILAGIT